MTERYELRSVVDVLRGTIPASDFHDDGTERFFGITEIGQSGQGPVRRVTVATQGRKVVRLEKGDVALVLMGRIGTSTLVDDADAGAVLGRECVALRVASLDVLPEWLYAWTRSPDFGDQALRRVKGTTMTRLGTRDLLSFTIPVPAVERQEEIVKTLTGLRVAIRATSGTLADLERLEQLELTLGFLELQQ